MLLAIDSGNTNTVFAIYDSSGNSLGEWRSSSKPDTTADEYGVWLLQLLSHSNIDRSLVKSAIVATVVPTALYPLKELCRKYFDVDPQVVGVSNLYLGVDILLDQPQEVGSDRIVNAISAHHKYGGPLIVLDFGTATTFDVVDKNGNYAGGIITPGVNLSQEALYLAAAKLPRVAIVRPNQVIGKSTIDAMQSGIYWGYLSMLEGVIKRIEDEFGSSMKVIATGGLASLFADATNLIECADSELTLRGLYIIHKLNTPTSDV